MSTGEALLIAECKFLWIAKSHLIADYYIKNQRHRVAQSIRPNIRKVGLQGVWGARRFSLLAPITMSPASHLPKATACQSHIASLPSYIHLSHGQPPAARPPEGIHSSCPPIAHPFGQPAISLARRTCSIRGRCADIERAAIQSG